MTGIRCVARAKLSTFNPHVKSADCTAEEKREEHRHVCAKMCGVSLLGDTHTHTNTHTVLMHQSILTMHPPLPPTRIDAGNGLLEAPFYR